MSFHFSTIAQYHQQLLAGTTSCTAAVQHYTQRIAQFKHLNAFTQVYDTEALAAAAQLDAQRDSTQPLPPLYGVVVGIKDVLNYSGHQVSAGSHMLRHYTATYTATAVQRLLQAGAIVMGMCNCDEFAMGSTNENSAYGPVLNAADNSKVSGGSSGGSAVAVQAGLCMVSLGSDTGGSVRQPADFCGVVGLKPTYGRISRYGLIAYASSFDQVGIFATNVADAGLVLQCIAGPDALDGTCSPLPMPQLSTALPAAQPTYRFAYLEPTLSLPGLDPHIKTTIQTYFAQLQAQGHVVDAVPFNLLDYIVPTYYVLTTAEASSNLGRYDGVRFGHRASGPFKNLTDYYLQNRSQGFGPEVKRRIMLGSFVLSAGFYDAYFTKAQQVRQLICQQTHTILSSYDAILMPVSPTTAFGLGEKMADPIAMYLADIYTVFANLAGLPAMALPLFTHANGMPFGIQVLTNAWKELLLHQISMTLLPEKTVK
ncbi:MAG: Asp-tRNA(Asn)/Glu-tRNA(Gln) amidotransferase subunit GatA [Bacteroidetes bacterium]|nr:MAG: Asp-tRNA(Asn)/Glu-tRNA(Gln) amidotransferase subunit GatA [Bacteroidota bacterium]